MTQEIGNPARPRPGTGSAPSPSCGIRAPAASCSATATLSSSASSSAPAMASRLGGPLRPRRHAAGDRSDRYLTREGRLILCASHGALFRPATAIASAAPAPGQALTPWPVRVEGDRVVTANGHALRHALRHSTSESLSFRKSLSIHQASTSRRTAPTSGPPARRRPSLRRRSAAGWDRPRPGDREQSAPLHGRRRSVGARPGQQDPIAKRRRPSKDPPAGLARAHPRHHPRLVLRRPESATMRRSRSALESRRRPAVARPALGTVRKQGGEAQERVLAEQDLRLDPDQGFEARKVTTSGTSAPGRPPQPSAASRPWDRAPPAGSSTRGRCARRRALHQGRCSGRRPGGGVGLAAAYQARKRK